MYCSPFQNTAENEIVLKMKQCNKIKYIAYKY